MGKNNPITATCSHCGKEYLYYDGPNHYNRVKNHYCGKCGVHDRLYHGHCKNGEKTHEYEFWRAAKKRARKKKIPFNIHPDDIVIPDFCPILGIPIAKQDGRPNSNSPSLDRIIPELGYVPGNIMVISWRANDLKKDATFEELILMGEFFKKYKQEVMNDEN